MEGETGDEVVVKQMTKEEKVLCYPPNAWTAKDGQRLEMSKKNNEHVSHLVMILLTYQAFQPDTFFFRLYLKQVLLRKTPQSSVQSCIPIIDVNPLSRRYAQP